MSSTFKPSNRVRITKGEHAGLVGIIDMVQEEFDDQPAAALVNISGAVNDEPFTLNDWFLIEELEHA